LLRARAKLLHLAIRLMDAGLAAPVYAALAYSAADGRPA
jgi:hypothetical protein